MISLNNVHGKSNDNGPKYGLVRQEVCVMLRKVAPIAVMLAALLFSACGNKKAQIVELEVFPMDNLNGLITLSGVEIDKAISSDGNGSLKITAPDSTVVRLYEVRDIDIENARLIYQARVRCENLDGAAFLEMWCHFPGTGEFFSRGLQTPITGTTDWTMAETPFFLKKGQKPDFIRLNFVVAGKGNAWIDDIKLLGVPANWGS
jgi:hypothetical protein